MSSPLWAWGKVTQQKDKPSQQFSGLQLVKASNFEEVQASVRASLLLPPIEEENSGVSQEFIDTKKNKPSISLISSSTTCCNKKSLLYTLVAFVFGLVIGYQKGLSSTAPTQSSSINKDIDKEEHQDMSHYGYDKEQHTRTCPIMGMGKSNSRTRLLPLFADNGTCPAVALPYPDNGMCCPVDFLNLSASNATNDECGEWL